MIYHHYLIGEDYEVLNEIKKSLYAQGLPRWVEVADGLDMGTVSLWRACVLRANQPFMPNSVIHVKRGTKVPLKMWSKGCHVEYYE